MKQIIGLFLLSITLMFVCCEDKSTNSRPRDDPGYYYPRQETYGWRYFHKGFNVPADTFDLVIIGTNRRHDDVGWDRLRKDIADTNFLYERADTLFLEKVGQSVPDLKILVGPIKAGAFWKDSNFEYLIQGFEACTLTINGETYKGCAKIMKTKGSSSTIVYEWWAPGVGEVKEIEVDDDIVGFCRYTKELLYFDRDWVDP